MVELPLFKMGETDKKISRKGTVSKRTEDPTATTNTHTETSKTTESPIYADTLRIPKTYPKGPLRLPTDQLPTITGNFHEDNLPSFFEEAERVIKFNTCSLSSAGYSPEQIDLFKVECVFHMVGKANTTPASRALSHWIKKYESKRETITFDKLWSEFKKRHWSNEYKAHWRSRIQKCLRFDLKTTLLSDYLNKFFMMSEMAGMSHEEAYTALKDKVNEDVKIKLDNYWDRYKDIYDVHNQVQANDVGVMAKASIALAEYRPHKRAADVSAIAGPQPSKKPRQDEDDDGPCRIHSRIPPGSPSFHKHGDCNQVRKSRGLPLAPRQPHATHGKAKRLDGKTGRDKSGPPPSPCNLCGKNHWQSDCPYLAAAKISAAKDQKETLSTNAISVSLDMLNSSNNVDNIDKSLDRMNVDSFEEFHSPPEF